MSIAHFLHLGKEALIRFNHTAAVLREFQLPVLSQILENIRRIVGRACLL